MRRAAGLAAALLTLALTPAPDEIPVDGAFLPTYDDGRRLYGFARDLLWPARHRSALLRLFGEP